MSTSFPFWYVHGSCHPCSGSGQSVHTCQCARCKTCCYFVVIAFLIYELWIPFIPLCLLPWALHFLLLLLVYTSISLHSAAHGVVDAVCTFSPKFKSHIGFMPSCHKHDCCRHIPYWKMPREGYFASKQVNLLYHRVHGHILACFQWDFCKPLSDSFLSVGDPASMNVSHPLPHQHVTLLSFLLSRLSKMNIFVLFSFIIDEYICLYTLPLKVILFYKFPFPFILYFSTERFYIFPIDT